MKKILSVMLLFFCMPAMAASPQTIYNNILKANGFWAAPKLVILGSNEVQAENRGVTIVLYKGLISYVRNDHELALVLSHELAHGKLWHRGSSHRNEYAADKLGMVYMKKAGYNGCLGAKILLRFNKSASSTHPAAKDRYNKTGCPIS